MLANKGKSLVLAGYRQPLAVHLLANAINAALGNVGTTLVLQDAPEPKAGSIAELAKSLNAGKVDTLVILGGNPVYNAPADLNWDEAQAKAKTVVRLGYYEDESFPLKGWGLPLAHFLESWGDARTADGTLVPIQPLIEPLFGGLTELEVMARIAGFEVTSPYAIVRETFRGIAGSSEEVWKQFLHDGFLADSAANRRRSVSICRRHRRACAGGSEARRRADQGQARSRFPSRLQNGRRPLQQQRLDAGIARPHHQDDVGKRHSDERQNRRRTWVWRPENKENNRISWCPVGENPGGWP